MAETSPSALRLDHIGIAVPDLEEAREAYARMLGSTPSPVEEIPGEGVRVVFFDLGGMKIELLEAMSPESPIQKFLDRGQPGVHHVALALEEGELGAHFEKLKSLGLPVVGRGVRRGSRGSEVFFLHPRGACGVLFEFVRRVNSDRESSESA